MSISLPQRLTFLIAVATLLMPFTGDHASGQGIYAGNGQGFRIGGARMGMHFGGGQGTSIGGPNFGMRFGNGQGARFGIGRFGMQFGGGQGTQIGRLATTPGVQPGTYFYDDVRRSSGTQPGSLARTAMRTPPGTVGTPTPAIETPATSIRLTHPGSAQEPIEYNLNGTPFRLAPGHSVYMAAGKNWRLEFPAGDGLSNRVATLNESGNYAFAHSEDEGWVLNEEAALVAGRTEPQPLKSAPTMQSKLEPSGTPQPQAPNQSKPNSLLEKMPLDEGTNRVLESDGPVTELIVDPQTPTPVGSPTPKDDQDR